jgi:hypothetical protein
MHRRWTTILVLLSFGHVACYNTYNLKQDDFAELQRIEEGEQKVVETNQGQSLSVTRDTPLYVRSEGGRRYPITPFNFHMTASQLVAPDRDYILMLNQLKSYEVDVPSTGKTVALISLGAAAAAGLIIGLIITQGEKSFN